MLFKYKTEQVSFSFWAGYLLVDFFDIDASFIEEKNLSKLFEILKSYSFGKCNQPLKLMDESIEWDYGNYDLAKINFSHYFQIPQLELNKSITEFVINNYLESRSFNEAEICRLKEIIDKFIEKNLVDYPIILTSSESLPILSYGGTYDFLKPYLFINFKNQKFAHLEIAYD